MLKKNYGASGGEQKYFIFLSAANIKAMTFMVYKFPVKDDDRWLCACDQYGEEDRGAG
jgi:hypothetical protein